MVLEQLPRQRAACRGDGLLLQSARSDHAADRLRSTTCSSTTTSTRSRRTGSSWSSRASGRTAAKGASATPSSTAATRRPALRLTNSPRHLAQFNLDGAAGRPTTCSAASSSGISAPRRTHRRRRGRRRSFVPNLTVSSARELPKGFELSASSSTCSTTVRRSRLRRAPPGQHRPERPQLPRQADRTDFPTRRLTAMPSRAAHPQRTPVTHAASRDRQRCSSLASGVDAIAAAPRRPSTGRRARPEYLIKAAYLYNFAMFVEWPTRRIRQRRTRRSSLASSAPIRSAGRWTGRSQDKTHQQAPDRHRAAAVESRTLRHCHIVFVSVDGDRACRRLVDAPRRSSVLIVGERDDVLQAAARRSTSRCETTRWGSTSTSTPPSARG